MSYTDQSRRSSPASIAVVIGVHVAIGYAMISGLAYNVIKHRDIFTVGQIPDDTPQPPPPKTLPVERSKLPTRTAIPQTPAKDDSLQAEQTIIQIPTWGDVGGNPNGGGSSVLPQADPPKANLARDAIPGSDRSHWITTEDYPAAAIRQSVQGVVTVSAMVGTDGRVRSCVVSQSSGNQLLDDTTCRLYTKRAHFTPARDADGNPTTAQRTDRFRWQIPNE